MPLNFFRRNKAEHEAQPTPSTIALAQGDVATIDLDGLLEDDEYGLSKKYFPYGRLVAIIQASNQTFGLIDMREDRKHTDLNRDFMLIDTTFNPKGTDKTGYAGIDKGEGPVKFGRVYNGERFPETQGDIHVSRDQFQIEYSDAGLIITSNGMNNTWLTTAFKPQVDRADTNSQKLAEKREFRTVNGAHIKDPYTVLHIDGVKKRSNFAEATPESPYGYLIDREGNRYPIIGRKSSEVNGGIWGSANENLLVDGQNPILRKLVFEVGKKIDTNLPIRRNLSTIRDFVREAMPYSLEKVDELTKDLQTDKIIHLSEFVTAKTGVCRHQGLLACYLIQELIKAGSLKGAAHTERNIVEGPDSGHAWAVFEQEAGPQLIIDPAQKFVGTKKDAKRLINNLVHPRWNYDLPED